MMVDISKKIITLDNQKLSGEIAKYECISNQTAYLFMSQGTMKALSDLTAMNVPDIKVNTDNCILAKYKGRKVFRNDDLEFGEIEVR